MVRKTKAAAEQTREGVLDAAVTVFLEQGVARASLDAVARGAGVTRGAVYWHFRDKLDLFLALDDRARLPFDEMIANSDPATPPDDPLGALADAVVQSFVALEADPSRRRVLEVLMLRCEYVDEMAPALERQRRMKADCRERFRHAFERAREKGLLAPGWRPETAALALQTMTLGLVLGWLKTPDDSGLTARGAEVVRCFLAATSCNPGAG